MSSSGASKQAGRFIIAPGREVYGELTVAGESSSLCLHDKEPFHIYGDGSLCITGVLLDLAKVTLVDCLTPGPGSAMRGQERSTFAEVFPHYVVVGDRHIAPTERSISQVRIVVDDAASLFYDFDAFGHVIDARPLIDQVVRANNIGREIMVGPNPKVLYFTGKDEILSTDTEIGKLSVTHRPQHNLGGPNGVWLKNTIVISVAFTEPVTFANMISHTYTLVRYFGLLIGRPQGIVNLGLSTASGQDRVSPLEVHWSLWPTHKPSRGEQGPHPSDVLIDAVRDTEAFSRVLVGWLSRRESWGDARGRFFDCFAKQLHYDVDRLVACANMFDLLPSSAVPGDVQLSEDLREVGDTCRNAFKRLAKSYERDRVLDALVRMGKSSLRHKIQHRMQIIPEAVRMRFPQLSMVIREAVNCRNHYVHGREASFEYNKDFDAVSFFTDTLEFVFAASDLVEAGWNIAAWAETHTVMFHPFARYRVGYKENLQRLEALLSP